MAVSPLPEPDADEGLTGPEFALSYLLEFQSIERCFLWSLLAVALCFDRDEGGFSIKREISVF